MIANAVHTFLGAGLVNVSRIIEIRLRCDDCGSPKFRLAEEHDSSVLCCNDCGQNVGTVAEIAAQIKRAGKSPR